MWTEVESERVRDLLTQFNGAAEVCAVMGCDVGELDALCQAAFGMSFARAKDTFAARGRVMLRQALMAEALDGNSKALDMLAREQLGMGPVEMRRREEATEDAGAGSGRLGILQGKRKDRRSRATG